MAAGQGIQPLVNYAGITGDANKVNALLALIPNIDNPGTSGPQGGGGFLDEMSPAAAVQLRIELTALAAAVS